MGQWATRRNRRKTKRLTVQVYDRLNSMLQAGMGRSRKEDKKNGIDYNFIYSTKTYETYKRECRHYIRWCKEHHPGAVSIDDLKPYINDYLQHEIDRGMSAYTISTRKMAICKLFGIRATEIMQTPTRRRVDIKRSRNVVTRDKHISAETEARLARITSCTGLRKRELMMVTGEALKYRDGAPYLHITAGTKGGKIRDVEICGETQEEVNEIISMFKAAGPMRVLPKIHNAYDNHHYRAVYANRLLKKYSRPIDSLSHSERYVMRRDRAGEILDRRAMYIVSKNLGHNRLDVIAQSYIYHT